MITYTLTPDELATFSDDNVRAGIRSRLAVEYAGEDTIIIADEEGNEWDRLVEPTEPIEVFGDMAPTSEELELRLEASEELKEAVALDESVTRPLVMQKLRLEARSEVRDQLRSKDETIATLRAENARLKMAANERGQKSEEAPRARAAKEKREEVERAKREAKSPKPPAEEPSSEKGSKQ